MPEPKPVELVPVELVRPLRGSVLRPGRPAQESVYPGDDHPMAAHAAIFVSGVAVAVAVGSILPEEPPWPVPTGLGPACWRIRGMATAPEFRGRGLGRQILDTLVTHGRRSTDPAALVWCNARVPALSFYRSAGFEGRGEVMDFPGIGPHLAMFLPPSGETGKL